MERKTLNVAEVAKMLGIGERQVRTGIRNGEIPGIMVGRRFIISRRALEDLLERGTNRDIAS